MPDHIQDFYYHELGSICLLVGGAHKVIFTLMRESNSPQEAGESLS